MIGTSIFKLLVPTGIVVLAFLLRDAMKQQFHIPIKSFPPDVRINVTLLGTNDLHSTVSGLGLKSYPELISGSYSKLVRLIKSIRCVSIAILIYLSNKLTPKSTENDVSILEDIFLRFQGKED